MSTAKLVMWGLVACSGVLAAALEYLERTSSKAPKRPKKVRRYKS